MTRPRINEAAVTKTYLFMCKETYMFFSLWISTAGVKLSILLETLLLKNLVSEAKRNEGFVKMW